MKTLLIIAGALLVALIGAVVLLARNHKQWLARQTPAGIWQGKDGPAKITLQFDGGPGEGPYKELVESDGKQVREFGHWSASARDLKMIIMATDVKSHPRFGIDTGYLISYVGPTSIKIDGPDRPGIVYTKAPAGVEVKFDTEVEPDGPANRSQPIRSETNQPPGAAGSGR
jgi:methionine-rich copper-binding protein CopC